MENSSGDDVCANLESVRRCPVEDFCKLCRSGAEIGVDGRGDDIRAGGAPLLIESDRPSIIDCGLMEVGFGGGVDEYPSLYDGLTSRLCPRECWYSFCWGIGELAGA